METRAPGRGWNGGRQARKLGFALLCVGAFMVMGCSHEDDTASAAAALTGKEDLYRVSADATPFYRFGPQQPNGPDLSLKKDTRLVMLKRSYGYSQVRTQDNQVGMVGTVDLTPLSDAELATERAAMLAAQNAQNPQKRSSAIVGEYTIPPEAGSRERLPEPEVKATPPPGMFRY